MRSKLNAYGLQQIVAPLTQTSMSGQLSSFTSQLIDAEKRNPRRAILAVAVISVLVRTLHQTEPSPRRASAEHSVWTRPPETVSSAV
jgi:hypothetical protein